MNCKLQPQLIYPSMQDIQSIRKQKRAIQMKIIEAQRVRVRTPAQKNTNAAKRVTSKSLCSQLRAARPLLQMKTTVRVRTPAQKNRSAAKRSTTKSLCSLLRVARPLSSLLRAASRRREKNKSALASMTPEQRQAHCAILRDKRYNKIHFARHPSSDPFIDPYRGFNKSKTIDKAVGLLWHNTGQEEKPLINKLRAIIAYQNALVMCEFCKKQCKRVTTNVVCLKQLTAIERPEFRVCNDCWSGFLDVEVQCVVCKQDLTIRELRNTGGREWELDFATSLPSELKMNPENYAFFCARCTIDTTMNKCHCCKKNIRFEQTGGMASTPPVAFWCKPCAVRARDGVKCPHLPPQTTMQPQGCTLANAKIWFDEAVQSINIQQLYAPLSRQPALFFTQLQIASKPTPDPTPPHFIAPVGAYFFG